jgi:hypothetical protein
MGAGKYSSLIFLPPFFCQRTNMPIHYPLNIECLSTEEFPAAAPLDRYRTSLHHFSHGSTNMNSLSDIGRKMEAGKSLSVIFLLPFSCQMVLLLVTCSFASATEQPPNVVLIFADDLGYGDLGCYGATKVQTPNIDRLAAEGRRFTDAHSVSAVCTPSRYALLTGEYPLRASGGRGVWGPASITSPLLIDTGKITIADVFKNSGYDTAVVGKWHLGFKEGAGSRF